MRWKASAVEKWLASRGAFLVGRAPGAFQEQVRVISQVTCEGRSRNSWATVVSHVREADELAAVPRLDIEFFADKDEAGMPLS